MTDTPQKLLTTRQRHIWIVEMRTSANEWYPTVGAALDLDQGEKVLRFWHATNPHDNFRLRKYWPESDKSYRISKRGNITQE